MGVPEVWRWRQERIEVYRLAGGSYEPAVGSRALIGFPIEQAAELLRARLTSDDNALVRSFRSVISTRPGD